MNDSSLYVESLGIEGRTPCKFNFNGMRKLFDIDSPVPMSKYNGQITTAINFLYKVAKPFEHPSYCCLYLKATKLS